MSRTGVRRRKAVLMLVLALVVTALLTWAGGPAGAGQTDRTPARTYTVRSNDTLWRIAQRFSGPGEDPRPLVDAIAVANDVDPGSIVPGLVLRIPAVLG